MARIDKKWKNQTNITTVVPPGEAGVFRVEVRLRLGVLSPKDLAVDIYYGPVDSKADLLDRETVPLQDFTQEEKGMVFRGEIPCQEVGRFGFRVRVLPSHPLLVNPYSLGLILWG